MAARKIPDLKVGSSNPIWDAHLFFFFICLAVQRALGPSPHRDHDSSSLEAEHRSYEPGVAGSIPAWSIQRL